MCLEKAIQARKNGNPDLWNILPVNFSNMVLQKLINGLKECAEVLAIWEGGSAANSTSDKYSDIDINILADGGEELIFPLVEDALRSISEIVHVWNEPKSLWPELTQKVYFLKDSPKHFFVDVALFPQSAAEIFAEFMQVERHGSPVVHFDPKGLIKSQSGSRAKLLQKQQKRLAELLDFFPVYRTEVFKELDRGHAIDAFAFYQSGMLRPLVEVLGMLYRPYRFDFGLRYLERSFPAEVFQRIEKFLFVENIDRLKLNAPEVEEMFYQSVAKVKESFISKQ